MLAGLAVEEREEYMPQAPRGLSADLSSLFRKHFKERAQTELEYFGTPQFDSLSVPVNQITRQELNGPKIWDMSASLAPDLVISYGVHKLSGETLGRFPRDRWNIHGGLSPWYRGAITHFWPSYMLEPQMTGVTLHELTVRLDAGGIVHQTAAPLVRGDGIHALACRAVQAFGEELPFVLEVWRGGSLLPPVRQKSSGKLWVSQDWRPEHLRVVYETFGNHVVDAYLDKSISNFVPELVRQFE